LQVFRREGTFFHGPENGQGDDDLGQAPSGK
jgi:hypothetical protein